jgi:hypothetical protein
VQAVVANGRLTQAEADEKKTNLSERITALVNGELREGEMRQRDDSDGTDEEPADSTSS